MTSSAPRKRVAVSLDADIVTELQENGPLSPQVNEALRAVFERRRQGPQLSVWSRS